MLRLKIMIQLKTKEEIEKLAEGGQILAQILEKIVQVVKSGVATQELDKLARTLIRQAGGQPAFLGYGKPSFPAALCVSVNAGVVHGIPGEYKLQEGDVVGLDLGLIYEGLYTDHARTVIVGRGTPEARSLIEVARESLAVGIEAAQVGSCVGDISYSVQQVVEKAGFTVVRELTGHGVGYAVHEAPQVPNFGRAGSGEKLKEGLVIAIEPMITVGNPAVVTGGDGWTVEVASGAVAAHEEHTVAITEAGPRILTQL
jgi:methionyl aminopeptidase